MISLAIGELQCPSLDYVYNMTWAEFRIRLHSYNRQEDKKIYMLRELAWVTYVAPHQNPKKMKKNKEAFWSLKKRKKRTLSKLMRDKILEAKMDFFEQKQRLQK